jgi:hypothetical protein
MKLTKIVIGIVLFTSISACSLNPFDWFKSDPVKLKWTPTPIKWDLKLNGGCSTENDIALQPGTQVQHQEVEINRKFQRVIRHGCNGEILSDTVVTTDQPDGHVTIGTAQEIKALAYMATVRNRTTCNGTTRTYAMPENETAERKPSARLHINTSPTLLHLHVLKDRENYLDYEFFSCSEITAARDCKDKSSLEKGTVILKVNYVEETLPTTETTVCDPKTP